MYIWQKVAAMDDRRSQNVISAFPRLDIILNLIFPKQIMTHCMLHIRTPEKPLYIPTTAAVIVCKLPLPYQK